MRELNLIRAGRLEWIERPDPVIKEGTDAVVRPIVVGRCDGDALPIHGRVSRAMQVGLKVGRIDPAVGHICGSVPFKGPFAIGHECIAEVIEVGPDVASTRVGDRVVVPWSISCGSCGNCVRGLTSKCLTSRQHGGQERTLAAYGFGATCGDFGGMASDLLRVPFADHMLVPLPSGLDPLRAAAASDNLADAWRTVAPFVTARAESKVLVVGGGAQSIGLYAAGIARALGASVVDYVDFSSRRLRIADQLGANPVERSRKSVFPQRSYDVVVEASSTTHGLRYAVRATAPGGTCTAVGYYIATNTGVPLMHMYANDVTLHLGVSHPRAVLPELLNWLHESDFRSDFVTTTLADFDEAPDAYASRTTKLVLHRAPVTDVSNR